MPKKPSSPDCLASTLHIQQIVQDFEAEATEKYMLGFEEHGGDLRTKRDLLWLVEQAIVEAIDSYVYLHTLRERLRVTSDMLRKTDNNARPDTD